MNKPMSVVLAFDADDTPIPSSRLSDELAKRFPELIKMPPADRRVAIDQIFEFYKDRR